jgi:hypothetical protein
MIADVDGVSFMKAAFHITVSRPYTSPFSRNACLSASAGAWRLTNWLVICIFGQYHGESSFSLVFVGQDLYGGVTFFVHRALHLGCCLNRRFRFLGLFFRIGRKNIRYTQQRRSVLLGPDSTSGGG